MPVSWRHGVTPLLPSPLQKGMHKRLMQKWQQALKDADDWLAEMNFGSARQRVAALALKMRDPDQPGFTSFFARDDMGAMLDIKL